MLTIAKILFVLGIASIVYGAARWQAIEEVTAKSLRAFDDYTKAGQLAGVGATEGKHYTWTGWDYPKELQRLKMRLHQAGGLYHGQPDFILFGALGLMLIAVSYYFWQRKKTLHEPMA